MSRTSRTVAAVDLGAESGRVAAVSFDGERLDLSVAHRFAHVPSVIDGVLRWDLDVLQAGIDHGLDVLAHGDVPLASVGVDTWGVDFGLLDACGQLVDRPTCYRDPRQSAARALAINTLGADRVYGATGVQIIDINTIFALLDDARNHPDRLAQARTLLMMADVFHHRLSGSTVTELTAASTSGCYDTASNAWATDLLDALDIPTHFLPEVVPPGTDVGALRGEFAQGKLAGARVILPPGHDTACAVVGTPLADPDGLYISSGTWSLVGVETPRPVITAQTRAANITNEAGYGGTIRLLRNVTGLWILQACRNHWAQNGLQLDYAEMAELARATPPLRFLINPNAPEFLAIGDMPGRIQAYCKRIGSAAPTDVAEVIRCVIDSLALSYRHVVEDLHAVTGRRVPSINIVGGGSKNQFLSQLTSDAVGVPVHCGPVEATVLGNAASQLVALGELNGLGDIRRVVAATSELVSYSPHPSQAWDVAYEHFTQIVAADRRRDGLSAT